MSKHVFCVGDALAVLKTLPAESVHCVVTSPPYLGLRDYGVEGQIGLEKTPEEYVAKLVEVFREVRRVLRHDGTLWLNLGDSYYSNILPRHAVLKPKDLVGIPWRVAFALQADGWWLRSDIIWHKPNPLPESVTDRPTKAHEYLFLLTKSERYFYDAEAIKEDAVTNDIRAPYGSPGMWQMDGRPPEKRNSGKLRENAFYEPVLKRNKRDVWTIPTQPLPEAHFATFPEALAELCVLAGTSERGCCPKCGAPWERLVESTRPEDARPRKVTEPWNAGTGLTPHTGYNRKPRTGYCKNASENNEDSLSLLQPGVCPHCGGKLEFRPLTPVPCVVLDPFGGSGTVSLVAKKLGRNSIYIDLNPAYCDMAMRRLELEQQPLFGPCEVRREVIA